MNDNSLFKKIILKLCWGLLQVGLLAGDGDTTLKLDPSYVIN